MLLRKSITNISLNLLSTGLGFLTSFVAAKLLGLRGTGEYFLLITILTISSTIATGGIDYALLKRVSSYTETKNNKEAPLLDYIRGVTYSIAIGLVVLTIGVTCAEKINGAMFKNSATYSLLILVFFAIIPTSIRKINASVLKGRYKDIESIFVEPIMLQAINLVTFIIFFGKLNLSYAISIYVLNCVFVALISSFITVKSLLFTDILTKLRSYFKKLKASGIRCIINLIDFNLIAESKKIFFISLSSLVFLWADTLMLGVLSNASEVAIYGIGAKLSGLVSVVLTATNSVFIPRLSFAFSHNKITEARTLLLKANIINLVCSGPVSAIFLIFPETILGIFGSSFANTQGIIVLRILSVNQLINAFTGCSGLALVMSDNHLLVNRNMLISNFVNIVLNFILIKFFGAIGAAIGTIISFTFLNISNFVEINIMIKRRAQEDLKQNLINWK